MAKVQPPFPEYFIGNDVAIEDSPQPENFPYVFQHSVTLTAKMWQEGNSTGLPGTNDEWRWIGLRLPPKYAPLLIALCCSIAVMLLAISGAVVWRCILLPSRKKEYCKNIYEEVIAQSGANGSHPTLRDTTTHSTRRGHWAYHSRLIGGSSMLCRSATMGAIHLNNYTCGESSDNRIGSRPKSSSLDDGVEYQALINRTMPRVGSDPESDLPIDFLRRSYPRMALLPVQYSRSTPSLEDLYSKVRFSKKRRNRMRKDEAAIIAVSKSRSGHDKNSMALTGSAVVVYKERTAL